MEEEKAICSKIKLIMRVRVQTSFNDLSKTQPKTRDFPQDYFSLFFYGAFMPLVSSPGTTYPTPFTGKH